MSGPSQRSESESPWTGTNKTFGPLGFSRWFKQDIEAVCAEAKEGDRVRFVGLRLWWGVRLGFFVTRHSRAGVGRLADR